MWTFPPIVTEKKPDESLADHVVRIARSIVGQKELSGNAGFHDPDFQKRMQEVGFKKGEAWCAYTGELIWKEAFGQDHPFYDLLDQLFSASATKTFSNFEQNENFKTGQFPKRGALAIWRYGKGWQGHMGVVTELFNGPAFLSVEGNTNKAGGREGIEVAEKKRRTLEPYKPNGLNLVGFVYLPD